MDIRILRLFMAVAEHGSISAAANSLNMAQPVLSRHMRNLELELGVRVFDRKSRGVEPNENGRIVIEATRSIEANYRSALRDLAEAQTATAGSLRIGATESWLRTHVPAAVSQLTLTHPSARITVKRGSSGELVNDMLKARLDVVLAPTGAVQNYAMMLDIRAVYQSRYAILAAADHPARNNGRLELSDLHQWQWALPRNAFARDTFDAAFGAVGQTPPTPTIELEDASAILGITLESRLLSYGALPDTLSCLAHEITCPALDATVDQGCMTVRKSKPSPLGRVFIQILCDLAGC